MRPSEMLILADTQAHQPAYTHNLTIMLKWMFFFSWLSLCGSASYSLHITASGWALIYTQTVSDSNKRAPISNNYYYCNIWIWMWKTTSICISCACCCLKSRIAGEMYHQWCETIWCVRAFGSASHYFIYYLCLLYCCSFVCVCSRPICLLEIGYYHYFRLFMSILRFGISYKSTFGSS